MPQASLTRKTQTSLYAYSALRKQVEQTLLLGQRKIEAAKVETYWKTGKIIQEHLLHHRDNADYGSAVVIRLAKDLNVSETVLYRCLKFAQKYPNLQKVAGQPLFSWTHYCSLIAIDDDKQRLSLENTASKNAWTTEELAARIRDGREEDGEPAPAAKPQAQKLLSPLRGQLYTYQLITRKTLGADKDDSELLLDLGFGIFRDVEPRQAANLSENAIVESRPQEDAYKFYSGKRTAKDLYTYQALVEKVIDGDTLKVRLDLGFETWTRQVLRLRGIDRPELKTSEGEKAKALVQSHLKELDWIIIRSSCSDKYDRYLADIFIGDIFLNNLLLENGLARRMEE